MPSQLIEGGQPVLDVTQAAEHLPDQNLVVVIKVAGQRLGQVRASLPASSPSRAAPTRPSRVARQTNAASIARDETPVMFDTDTLIERLPAASPSGSHPWCDPPIS